MIKWLTSLWYKRLRRIDMEILWPACLGQASDLDHAKAAFARHALHDKAWLTLGRDKVIAFINAMKEEP